MQHAAAPAAENLLDLQLRQVRVVVAPTAKEYLPGAHLMQVETPLAMEYLPASQSTHEEAAASEYEPDPHSMHVEELVAPSTAE